MRSCGHKQDKIFGYHAEPSHLISPSNERSAWLVARHDNHQPQSSCLHMVRCSYLSVQHSSGSILSTPMLRQGICKTRNQAQRMSHGQDKLFRPLCHGQALTSTKALNTRSTYTTPVMVLCVASMQTQHAKLFRGGAAVASGTVHLRAVAYHATPLPPCQAPPPFRSSPFPKMPASPLLHPPPFTSLLRLLRHTSHVTVACHTS